MPQVPQRGHPRKFTLILAMLAVLTGAGMFSCQSPIFAPDPTSDAIEFESVWQYCKAWSIYQDSSIYTGRIPADPFVFSSPDLIMRAIKDTLKGNTYTGYVWPVTLQPPASQSTQAAVGSQRDSFSLFTFDSITQTIALLRIPSFEDPVYENFLSTYKAFTRGTGYPNLIIDLRHDGGGFIDQADSLISFLVPDSTPYILARQRDYDEAAKAYVTRPFHPWVTTRPPIFGGKHIVVIMDSLTASASELTVAGLYEGSRRHQGMTMRMIGTHSYGKGIGQIIITRRGRPLWMKITFLQLKGVDSVRIGNYHEIGIAPDPVPADIVQEGAALDGDPLNQQVFYAARMLDTTVTWQQIHPYITNSAGLAKTVVPAGYRVISEDSVRKTIP